jgi:translation initiation factor IF-2
MHQGRISSLKRFKDDAREVESGHECGIGIEGFGEIQIGDIIECYTTEEVATKL